MSKRIPFNVKFKPQIESGEYKVETRDGKTVVGLKKQILHGTPLLYGIIEELECCEMWKEDGTANPKMEKDNHDLFIVTPEPEMSEMEISLLSWLSDDTSGEIPMERMKHIVEARAAELLDLAKQQLLQSGELLTQEHHERLMETIREECKKDLPRWRNVEADKTYVGCVARYMDVNGDWSYCMSSGKLSDDCQYISIAALEKLPQEDESYE